MSLKKEVGSGVVSGSGFISQRQCCESGMFIPDPGS
jgi:hypothetical protein